MKFNFRETIPPLILLAFLLLWAGTIFKAGARIEAELTGIARSRAAELGYPALNFVFSGRDATVSGTVESESRKSELAEVIRSIYGARNVDLSHVTVAPPGNAPLPLARFEDLMVDHQGLIYLGVQTLGFLVGSLVLGLILGWSLFYRKTSRQEQRLIAEIESARRAVALESERVASLEDKLALAQEEIRSLKTLIPFDEEENASDETVAIPLPPGWEPSGRIEETQPELEPDDLTRIRGIGPVLAERLDGLGINRFSQVAEWTPEEIERLCGEINGLALAISRFKPVEEARRLANG